MPFHVVGQQVQKNMRGHAILTAVTNRPLQQVDAFQSAENALHLRQAFVAAHRIFGRQAPGIEIQNASGLGDELRIAREDPATVLPGADRVFMEPAPNSAITDAGYQTGGSCLASNIGGTEARQRQATLGGKFAGQCLNLDDDFWGEKPGGDPGAVAPLNRRARFQRSA